MGIQDRSRRLYHWARQRGLGGRLVIIPAVLTALIPYLMMVGVYLLIGGAEILRPEIEWPAVVVHFTLAAVVPIILAVIWRKTRPSRRIAWVYDWMGGGLLGLSAVFAGVGLFELVHPVDLGWWGWFLMIGSALVWGIVGTGLLVAATVMLSSELRVERQERQRLEALMEFTRRITSLEYQEILDEAVDHLCRLLQADSCALFLWDDQTQLLSPVAGHHDMNVYSEEYVRRMMKFKCPAGYGLTGWVMETGQPYICNDVMNDPRSQAVPGWKTGEKSSVLAPIQIEGRRLGVVRLTRKGLRQFTRDDLDLAISYANQAALVLEHGRIVKELSELSTTDSLTGLHNARHFHHVLDLEVKRAARYGQPLSLVMADSDSLKEVNDRYGHQRGDELLRRIGTVVKAVIRSTDYAFRYAGDEFMLVLPNTGGRDALAVADRIRLAMDSDDMIQGLHTSVSVGVATMPDHAHDGEQLQAAADRAMYESKRSGKNRVTLAHPDEAWMI